jgi:hypothetical protein
MPVVARINPLAGGILHGEVHVIALRCDTLGSGEHERYAVIVRIRVVGALEEVTDGRIIGQS